MASKKVQIGIDVTANTAGAKKTEEAMNKVAATSERADARAAAAAERAAQKEIASAEKAANAKIKAEAKITAETIKEAQRREKVRAQETAKGETAMAGAARSAGQKAAQVGYQVQDIAVQAQMGINATTIIAQQGSQLLGAFGPGGAIAGGLLAIGAIAAKVFYDMAKNAAITGEAMEDMSDKLKEAFEKGAQKSIEDFNRKLETSTDFVQQLRDAELELAETRDKRAQSDSRLIDSQLKLDEAAINYLAATGQILDKEKAIKALRDQAAEATKNAQIEEAQQQVAQAQARYDSFVKQRDDIQYEVAQAEKRMAELESRQSQLLADNTFSRGQDKKLVKAGVEKEGFQSLATQASRGQLDSIAKEIENLYKIIQGAPQRLEQHTQDSIIKLQDVYNVIETSEQQVSEITSKFDLNAKAQNLISATESLSNNAESVNELLKDFVPATQQQAQALAEIKAATSDLQIDAHEAPKVATNLQFIRNSLKAGQDLSVKNTDDMIQIMNAYNLKLLQQNNELKRVEAGIIR
jgi:hypothetical protein